MAFLVSRVPRPARVAFALVAFVAPAVLGCGGETPPADAATKRAIAQGEIVGASIEEGAVHAWRGLPFAAPPVDGLRWKAPRPPGAWEGEREALASGAHCPQLGGDPIQGEEDCLYLDVFAPAMAADAVPAGPDRLPVMFWIHGGGNSLGSGDMLPVSALARDNGVIVVTINYRLGIFGWLSHPALRASAETPADASGNFGTLDVIAALEWTRDNIAAFGGDPDNVTIFGESAGGVNVFSMLLSPKAKGLFHAAIAQSGMPATMSLVDAENYTDDPEAPGLPGSSSELVVSLMVRSGKAASRAEAKRLLAEELTDAEVEAFLRGFGTEALLSPFADLMADSSMPMYISPAILRDGVVIPRGEPLELLGRKGAYNAVPFIAGTNREESKLFLMLGSPHVETFLGLPSGLSNERLYDLEGEYGGLMWRAQGADAPVSAMRGAQGPTVWAYRFDWDEEPVVLGTDLSKLLGAAHAIEMFFVFGLTDLGWGNRLIYDDLPSAERLSASMRSYWANFAKTHRPGRGQADELPEWTPWNPGRRQAKYIIFDSDRDGGIQFGHDAIDADFVLERATQDPRLLNAEERCGLYQNFVRWSDTMSVAAYAAIGGGICAEWPIESRLPFPSLSHTAGDGRG